MVYLFNLKLKNKGARESDVQCDMHVQYIWGPYQIVSFISIKCFIYKWFYFIRPKKKICVFPVTSKKI